MSELLTSISKRDNPWVSLTTSHGISRVTIRWLRDGSSKSRRRHLKESDRLLMYNALVPAGILVLTRSMKRRGGVLRRSLKARQTRRSSRYEGITEEQG